MTGGALSDGRCMYRSVIEDTEMRILGSKPEYNRFSDLMHGL
jgi:hypothetical protein